MKIVLSAALLAVSLGVYAQSLINLNPGETSVFSATCVSCPPPPPPVTIEVPKPYVVPMPGNSHAVIHSSNAKLQGYAKCQECHSMTSATPAKVSASGVFVCSQYNFCTSGTTGGKSNCLSGVTFTHPVTGAPIVDPISKLPIVTGTGIGGYAPNTMTPQCRDCHYPHKTPGMAESQTSMIHEGCLDCHVAVGNSNRKPGIRD